MTGILRQHWLALPVIVLASSIVHGVGSAQASSAWLDPSFGHGGIVTTRIGDFGGGSATGASSLALQPDGKIVVAGTAWHQTTYDFALARYRSSGSLDHRFGDRGTVTTNFGPYPSYATALALQPDGKIVVAGYAWSGSSWDFALARYERNGALDPQFGSVGTVLTDFGSSTDLANGLALQPDGKIVVAGTILHTFEIELARYNVDGSLDHSFGDGGRVVTSFSPGNDLAYAVRVAPDGKIIVGGSSLRGGINSFALVRYNPNGSLDQSFGDQGLVTTSIGESYVRALALEPNGRILAVGQSLTSNYNLALARYQPDGSLDPTFGTGGDVLTSIGPLDDVAVATAIQANGKIVVAGLTNTKNPRYDVSYRVALVRYTSAGSLDRHFGRDGVITTAIGPSCCSYAAGVALRDGKIVVAGGSYSGKEWDFALARYLGSAPSCRVPKVKGKKLAKARNAILHAHCSVGRVTWRRSGVDKGRVLRQSPRPGVKRPRGAKVRLTVSRGWRSHHEPRLQRLPAVQQ